MSGEALHAPVQDPLAGTLVPAAHHTRAKKDEHIATELAREGAPALRTPSDVVVDPAEAYEPLMAFDAERDKCESPSIEELRRRDLATRTNIALYIADGEPSLEVKRDLLPHHPLRGSRLDV